MKPISPQPHDPLDELLAAAVHGELTAAQRVELDALLQHDPAARAAYQEIQTMHDLLEKNHRDAKPDPNFEERMISGVRQKVRAKKAQRESKWESLLFIWHAIKWPFVEKPGYTLASLGAACLVAMLVFIHEGQTVRGVFATMNTQLVETRRNVGKRPLFSPTPGTENFVASKVPQIATAAGDSTTATGFDYEYNNRVGKPGSPPADAGSPRRQMESKLHLGKAKLLAQQGEASEAMKEFEKSAVDWPANPALKDAATSFSRAQDQKAQPVAQTKSGETQSESAIRVFDEPRTEGFASTVTPSTPTSPAPPPPSAGPAPVSSSIRLADVKGSLVADQIPEKTSIDQTHAPAPAAPATPEPARKLVRDATLDLEVKKFQPTVDAITDFAKANGGYLDSSNSQRGGNGKLQGTVVAKVAPDKLDAFLLKLHDLGTLKNQSVSTEDVTKDYYDTEARLTNSRKMETQLQELLKHDTNKVADLLQVERELGRVRGEIEQMQGQLKLYDFQVQYATVTISVAEKDLNKAAAYLLQEHDGFALFVHDVEDAFTQAKAAADTFKAQILSADLQHGSGNSMSATLSFSVPPDQIDGFLAKVKSLGRVDNFKRTTSRVANDGGNSDEPADETRTDKDNAQVQLAIRADDESPRQITNLTVASTGDIDAQAQALKDDAVKAGAAVIASSFDRAPDDSETASINFRLPLAKVGDLMSLLAKLGREEALTVSRNDHPGQVAADANAPAEIDLKLHNVAAASFENEEPRQQTQLSIASSGNVDAQAQQLKADALKAGFAVIVSTFDRRPDGIEQAQLTFRVPLAKAADFTETLKKLGKVESFAIQRNDVAGPDSTDPNAPAQISLSLHSEPAMVAENRGVWPTLQNLFGGGVSAFLGSVETIGVLLAFVAPWVVTGAVLAFVGRRAWLMYQSRA